MKPPFQLTKWPALCLVAASLLAAPLTGAYAHGGVDDEKPDPAAAAPVTSGATQTDIEVHLEDLNQSSAATSVPLVGATVRGFLKHDDGDLLSRVTAVPEKTPGYYLIRFAEDAPNYHFTEAGNYRLELHVRPAKGDAFDTTVPFTLPKAAAASPAPLWRRAIPHVLGALMLATLGFWLSKRRKPHQGSGSGQIQQPTPTSEVVTAALLCLTIAGLAVGSGTAWAHGGVDDEKPDPAAAATAANAPTAPNIQPGQVSASATAGNVRVTLIARTSLAPPDVLAPGEVKLPDQTAQLLGLKTAPVSVGQISTGISINGQIAANPGATVRVSSLVPGRVTRLSVKQGDRVTRGQVVAIIESRAIGEAQSAFAQANARLQNARSNLQVVGQQARAGVFSRAPLEAASRTQAEAAGDVRVQEAAVTTARVALDTATRTASAGGYANPALEAARSQSAQATEALRTAQAALFNARASVTGTGAELRRRVQLAASGAYVSRPVQEARRALVAAQSARAAAQSEVATTRANLARAKSLVSEGLVSGRDVEAAQQAFDTATARLSTSLADETALTQELRRQQQLASSDVNNLAEVGAARSALAQAQADARTREAEVARASTGLRLSGLALSRERTIFGAGIADRREIGTARAGLQSAQASLYKARRGLEVANSTLSRERNVYRQNLNNTAQIQTARAALVSAQADAEAARSALKLLQSSPGGSVDVPVRAPIAGIVQTRDVALGELVQADAPLLTVADLGSLSLEAALFEADAARIQIGAPVTISSDAAPGQRFEGRISFIGSQVDAATRALTARAVISNPGKLRPGVFVRGQIQTGVGKSSLTVPSNAVLDDGAAKIVFVSKGGGQSDRYERREVTVGNENGGKTEIKTGLKQGEVLVTEGASALRAQAAKGS